jgi:hypothetical protein
MADETLRQLDCLTDIYHAYEGKITVIPAPEDGSLKSLVTFDSSKAAPVHRWYPFKEGYSHNLLLTLQNKGIISRKSGTHLLDPFCGVGTTLLSSQLSERNEYIKKAIGIERNPAISFIAKSKLSWHQYRTRVINKMLAHLRLPRRGRRPTYSIPELSTLTAVRENGKCAFELKVLQDLLFYRNWIMNNCAGTPELDFFMLAWTSVIEQASNTRKDGRALRLLEVSETPNVKELLIAQCEFMLEDLESLIGRSTKAKGITKVILGDGRCLPFTDSSFTALCYSPPYLNNIDYSEVYKLELWLRGDIASSDQFYSLRLSTFRSHPSITFPRTSICDNLKPTTWIRRLKSALIAALPNDGYREMREALFSGYIDDMLLTLNEQARVATPGAPIVCVVGNSLHGGKNNPTVPVCTDLLISAAAKAVGLGIDHLQIARQLPRRDSKNGWLRETIIVMRKPYKTT